MFASRHHGDETEWCMRAIKSDYDIIRVPRESVYHYPHEKYKPVPEYKNLLWLIKKHPGFPWYVIKRIGVKMQKSSYDEEYEVVTK